MPAGNHPKNICFDPATQTQLRTFEGSFRLPNFGRWFMSRQRGWNGLAWDFPAIPLHARQRQILSEQDIPSLNGPTAGYE